MKCPDCRADMALNALACRCGWKASAAPKAVVQPSLDIPATPQLSPEERERRHQAMRAMIKRLRETPTESLFERWTKNIRQETVDIVVYQAAGTPDKCLQRMQAEFVIDAKFRVIPLPQRQGLRDAARAERIRFEEEVAARGQVEAPA
jgi:hypothetical protein